MADEMDEIIADFLSEAEESLGKVDRLFVELETKGYDKDVLHEIFRSMHTIKGAAGFLGFQPIVDVSHSAENILKKLRDREIDVSRPLVDALLKSVDMLGLLMRHIKLKDGKEEDISALLRELEEALHAGESGPVLARDPGNGRNDETLPADAPPPEKSSASDREGHIPAQVQAESGQAAAPEKTDIPLAPKEPMQTLRIDVNRVDKVMDLTGEIVLVRNRLLTIANSLDVAYSGDDNIESLLGAVSFLDLVTTDMQLAVMKIRMQPLNKVFSKFPRLARDISHNIGKDVELVISGEGTEVDRTVIEHIGDPLVHIIRNAIDHGIEHAEERLRKGKPGKGRVEITAYQQGNQIIIEVSDDGRGIDLERVKKKALEKALISEEEAQRMTDETAANLIFLPGFSTMDAATELSGRGVGMDVVKTSIAKLNGYVEIKTEKDRGSTFRISIPLTLAIIQALMVSAGGAQYAIPLAPVEETLKVGNREITDVTGQKVLVVREKVLPFFELTDILGRGQRQRLEDRYVVVVAIGERRFCVAVDELLGQEEVVIKTIEGIDTNSSYTVGATITGEGKVVLILDLAGMSRNVLGLLTV